MNKYGDVSFIMTGNYDDLKSFNESWMQIG